MSNREEIQRLLGNHLKGGLSREEFDKLITLLNTLDDPDFREAVGKALDHGGSLLDPDFVEDRLEQLYPSLLAKVRESSDVYEDSIGEPPPRRFLWRAAVAAAGIFLVLWIGIRFRNSDAPLKDTAPLSAEQIFGGGNRATLTLADGRTLTLSDSQRGITVGENISYMDGTEIAGLGDRDEKPVPEVQLLTLATPNSAQYQLSLPDGSRVWLNAASSISYPAAFTGDSREVTLLGEAYFEVARDKTRPFIVHTDRQQVTVLGTSFNINAYTNEDLSKTTLLTGSVRITAGSKEGGKETEQILKPNQQGIVSGDGGTISVTGIDPYSAVAWKNGLFDFHGLTVDEAMRQIERWYNVRVTYKGPKPEAYLGGKMSRGVQLSTFLEFLEKDFHIRSELHANRELVLESVPKPEKY